MQITFPAFTNMLDVWCTENPIPQPYGRVLILRTPEVRYEVYDYDQKFFYIEYPSGTPSTSDILPPTITGTYLPSCNTVRELLSHITAVNEEKLEVGIWGPYPLQEAWSNLRTIDALDAVIGSDQVFYLHTEGIPCLLFTIPEADSPFPIHGSADSSPLNHTFKSQRDQALKKVWPLMAGCADGECILVDFWVTLLGNAIMYLQREGDQFMLKGFEGNESQFAAQGLNKDAFSIGQTFKISM